MTDVKLQNVECFNLPKKPDENTIYTLLPKNASDTFYRERTNRNIGWVTEAEQDSLRNKTIAIAGCGGMGGLLASIFLRLGVGEIRISDCEVFDVSNINRQFGASVHSVGKSKAFETGRLLREITHDTSIVVYPQGVCSETASQFLEGADVVCDEIEFWAIGSRILLHQTARKNEIPIFVCSTVGFGTRLMRFMPESYTMEKCVGLCVEKAMDLQQKIQYRTATNDEVYNLTKRLTNGLVPNVHGYSCAGSEYNDLDAVLKRLMDSNQASIIATNPSMAAGFLADRVLLQLLEESCTRQIVQPPEPPGYFYFDAATMQAKVVVRWEIDHA